MPQLEGDGIERAVLTKKRIVKPWVTRFLDEEKRTALATIADPIARRLKEIEMDLQKDKIEMEILEGNSQ